MIDVADFSQAWTARICGDPAARDVIETLWARREALATPIVQRAIRDLRALGAVGEGASAAEVDQIQAHAVEHFQALLALPTGRAHELGAAPLAFVHGHAVRRARGGVPLQLILQGYRDGHRNFWRAMCDVINARITDAKVGMRATMLLSDYCIEYTDLVSIHVTDFYLEESARLAEERTRLGLEVLEDLLNGVPPGTEQGWALCHELGLAEDRPMVVLVARSLIGADHAAGARAVSLISRGLESCLPREAFGRVVGVRGTDVVAVIAAAEPAVMAADRLRRAAEALAADAGALRIGVGLDAPTIQALPLSYRQAQIALDLGRGGLVSALSDAHIDDYLRHMADETALRLAPQLASAIREGALGRTLEAFAEADLSVKACARRLGVHNNTIYHRLNQVRRQTGLDPRTFAGLSALLTALALARKGG